MNNASPNRPSLLTLETLACLVTGRMGPGDISPERWPELIQLADQQGVAPMLLWAVRLGGIDTARKPLWAPLVISARNAAVHNILKEKALLAVQKLLGPAGVPVLWLKGAALAHTIYPEPHLRPMADLDFLVGPEQLDGAVRLLHALGYRPTGESTIFSEGDRELIRKVEYHVSLRGGPGDAVLLEVHHRLMSGGGALLSNEGLQWFRGETETFLLQGTPVTILKPEAQLLHLVAHAFLNHGEEDSDLLHLLDMHLLITKRGLDWPFFLDRAVHLGWTHAADLALADCLRLFHTPVPEYVLEGLVRRRPKGDRVSRMENLGGDGGRFQRVLDDFRDLAPSERARYAFRMVFPPPAYLCSLHHISPVEGLLPHYVRRWRGQALSLLAWIRRTHAR